MTSGGALLASAVVSLSWIPFHCWTWKLTVTPGWLDWNSEFRSATSCFGAEPSISHTVRVLLPPVACCLLPPPELEQPAMISAAITAIAAT
jgi:hypothetical protein